MRVNTLLALPDTIFSSKSLKDPWGVPLTRVHIPVAARPRLRLELQRLGVHRASLFPDLDGVGQYVYELWRND